MVIFYIDLILPKNAEQIATQFARKIKGKLIELDQERKIYRVAVLHDGQRYYFDFANFQAKTIEEDLGLRDFTINSIALLLSKRDPARTKGFHHFCLI